MYRSDPLLPNKNRPREYVCRVIGDCSPDRITAVDQLGSGENHAVYKVSYRDPHRRVQEVVVRFGSGDPAALLRAEREARVLTRIGGIAGPELYDFSTAAAGWGGSAMCLRYVRGTQLDLAEVGPADLARLGDLVGWLHAQAVPDLRVPAPAGPGLSAYLEERWQHHVVSRLTAIRDPQPPALQHRLRAEVDGVAATVAELQRLVRRVPDERLVLLHGDISGANVVWAPEPLLIDWEYARLGDRADEIAYLFTQNGLRAIQREGFWRGYARRLDPAQRDDIAERIRLWRPITLLGSVLWWLDAWSRREAAGRLPHPDAATVRTTAYYLEQAVRRLDMGMDASSGGRGEVQSGQNPREARPR